MCATGSGRGLEKVRTHRQTDRQTPRKRAAHELAPHPLIPLSAAVMACSGSVTSWLLLPCLVALAP